MPICKHCGEPIYQTRGGSWVHADGRGICSWAEPADPVPSEVFGRNFAALQELGYPADLGDDEPDEGLDDCVACDSPLSDCARDAACCEDCTHGANFAPRPEGRES